MTAQVEEAVLENPLLRRKILVHKLVLEKKLRTDEDIREAVRCWLKDPEAAERRYSHISDWDVSRVTDMSALFKQAGYSFNEDLSEWQTGNVTNMRQMFQYASSFTSDLSKWDTRNVTDMSHMFNGASSFTSDLSRWQIGKVTDLACMLSSTN